MKKNRILGFGIAIALTVTSCLPVLAADSAPISGDETTNASKDVTVTYEQAVSYTVTIPATATLSKDANSTITIGLGANTMMEKGAYLEATTSQNVDVSVNNETLTSKVTPPTGTGNRLNSTDTSCVFTLDPISNVKYAGTYTGTLTFNLKYTLPTV